MIEDNNIGIDLEIEDDNNEIETELDNRGDPGRDGPPGPIGPPGPANHLTIGTVQKGLEAQANITGAAPNQVLNLVIPQGDVGKTGMYVGEEEPKDPDVNVWINPTAEPEGYVKDSQFTPVKEQVEQNKTDLSTLDNKVNDNLDEAKRYTDEEIATFDFIKIVNELPESGLPNRMYLVPKQDTQNQDLFDEYVWINDKWEWITTKQIEVDLTNYVKNTDYANETKPGILTVANGLLINSSNGKTYLATYNKEEYVRLGNTTFISKGTLENVLADKIGTIETALEEI